MKIFDVGQALKMHSEEAQNDAVHFNIANVFVVL